MYEWRGKAQIIIVHVQDDLNLHILRMFEGTFSLDTAQMMCEGKGPLSHMQTRKFQIGLHLFTECLCTVNILTNGKAQMGLSI